MIVTLFDIPVAIKIIVERKLKLNVCGDTQFSNVVGKNWSRWNVVGEKQCRWFQWDSDLQTTAVEVIIICILDVDDRGSLAFSESHFG